MKSLTSLFLVGPMGVGKTTIGKVLAESLGLDFVDSDREIESATGADIPWIFDVEGEEGFRARESKMIEKLTTRPNIVLATGGGAILSEANRQWLKARGCVIYLRAPISQQIERTKRDKSRPLLQTANPAQKIRELMAFREPLYREVADFSVDTYRRGPKAVCNEIQKQLNGSE
ncbi:MAG: shikimate kinase AroK [Proteobacteria bacterium]|nr:shikimate kinase AroK [Pseudomonadales bacterium]MDA0805623.1 shikimate kinase AroK [Pseudomonadota bacterium]MDA0896724.1 shikimate kinase AroK [Pseudomonadota bacterium]MDA1244267.1 shikimate kinase AroK [Pseudomonadota bacterium]